MELRLHSIATFVVTHSNLGVEKELENSQLTNYLNATDTTSIQVPLQNLPDVMNDSRVFAGQI